MKAFSARTTLVNRLLVFGLFSLFATACWMHGFRVGQMDSILANGPDRAWWYLVGEHAVGALSIGFIAVVPILVVAIVCSMRWTGLKVQP